MNNTLCPKFDAATIQAMYDARHDTNLLGPFASAKEMINAALEDDEDVRTQNDKAYEAGYQALETAWQESATSRRSYQYA
jgi:Arc/MetJ-type ribon-helix-helix transcriptional regulator